MTSKTVLLKVLLRQRHLQGHAAFKKEYDTVAATIDSDLVGSGPGKAQFYRWLSGELVGLPYAHHCRVLEGMFPDRTAEQLFQPNPAATATTGLSEVVRVFPHRNSIPVDLWDRLIDSAAERVEILVHAALFLVERPSFIKTLAAKASNGTQIRLLFGDPDSPHVTTRGAEEQLGPGTLAARIRNALAFYHPLRGVEGIDMRFHETTLYNSIFCFDDEMIVNMHVYGLQGAHAPALYIRRLSAGDLFDTYSESFDTAWKTAKSAEF